jgi:hypothetical protein
LITGALGHLDFRFDTGASNRAISAVCGALAVEDQHIALAQDHHVIAVSDFAGEDHLGQRVLQIALDHPLQRTCAVCGIPARGRKPVARHGAEKPLWAFGPIAAYGALLATIRKTAPIAVRPNATAASGSSMSMAACVP